MKPKLFVVFAAAVAAAISLEVFAGPVVVVRPAVIVRPATATARPAPAKPTPETPKSGTPIVVMPVTPHSIGACTDQNRKDKKC